VTVAASFSATLVDEWVRSGLTDAVIAPGSRSTPLAIAIAREGRIALHVRLDERSAAFFALGIGLATGRPAVLLTTSGTAAVEVHAAVVEAHLSRVPMIVCTADRPPELHHVGAPQTIEQVGLFAGSLRWAVDPGVPDNDARGSWRSLASRLVAEATAGPMGPGPVHANLAFREPLLDAPVELPPGRRNGRPWHRTDPVRGVPEPVSLDALVGLARPAARGLIVAGASAGRPEVVRRLAGALGWPVLADPRSGARVPGGPGAPTVAAADALLRVESFAGANVPEIVLRLGEPWASKTLTGWLTSCAAAGAVQVLVDPHWAWRDPGHEADVVLAADPDHVMEALLLRLPEGGGPGRSAWASPSSWAAAWAEAEASAQRAIEGVLSRHGEATEPGVARALFAWSPPGSTVVASSSMPVRDLEWFAAPRSDPPRVLANRGANGIDGVASTTLGVAAAAAGTGGPVVGLLGDLAFLHDSTALIRGRREPTLPALLVVVDNGGGGIFSFLPQASELEEALFERLFGTPQRIDVADLARAAGCDTIEVTNGQEVPVQLDFALAHAVRRGPAVVVVRTDRKSNLAIHGELEDEVALALG
jgi:2-succinyl-5-enolpyruvyl-6-hydroxy-3-cyclohexene-1-carboxylate synthase